MTQCIHSEDIFEVQFVLFIAILNILDNSELCCFVAALQIYDYYFIAGRTQDISLLLCDKFLSAINCGGFYCVNFFL